MLAWVCSSKDTSKLRLYQKNRQIRISERLAKQREGGYPLPSLVRGTKNMKPIRIAVLCALASVAFLADSFVLNSAARADVLKITPAMNARIKGIMGYGIGRAVRYRRNGSSTIWVLNRIGKVKPITAQFVVSGGRIQNARVLVYRESHGHEIKRSSYLARLRSTCNTPNISGATLSVNSMKRMCRLAKYLHSQTRR